jgi:uncharacterized membrane protein
VGSWVQTLLAGLLGAVLVHGAILFAMPALTERDAWSVLAEEADTDRFFRLDPDSPVGELARSVDPLFAAAACRFDLGQGPQRIVGTSGSPYWSLSVYNRLGLIVYSLNDRTAPAGRLDVVLATPAQLLELRRQTPPELEQSVFVEAEIAEGIVVLRSFVPDETWQTPVGAFLDGALCEPL